MTVGEKANREAASSVFVDYLSRKSENTHIAQLGDLRLFCDWAQTAAPGEFPFDGEEMQFNPEAWRNITWGLVNAFQRWMIGSGYAVETANRKLVTLRTYANMAAVAGVITFEEVMKIRSIKVYKKAEGDNVDQLRPVSRRGPKKREPSRIRPQQKRAMRNHLDLTKKTGRRLNLVLALGFEMGLRMSEMLCLKAEWVDHEAGTMKVYRPKVKGTAHGWQTHEMPETVEEAIRLVAHSGDLKEDGLLVGVTQQYIDQELRKLGKKVGLEAFSAHDMRHNWVDRVQKNMTMSDLMDAGGWTSAATVMRYGEKGKVIKHG